jgi:hypothetical protein
LSCFIKAKAFSLVLDLDVFQGARHMLVAGTLFTAAMMTERRNGERGATDIAGTAVSDGGLVRVALRIVNLSRTGAMLELEERIALPQRFVLLFEHTAEPCYLVWQHGAVAGVQFIDTADLN